MDHNLSSGPTIDLQLNKISKRYWVPQDEMEAAPGWMAKLRRGLRRKEFWAVKNLSFGVPRGQALGIIGHNGAGKSTILKLLSGITAPTEGEIRIQGRITALLEVGSGFHPELTGRENVFLSGSILGMRRKEIHEKLEQVIDFAEIRPFIDTPVKRYSSGMFVRLGFSIAAHLEPDILLLDEVLAVGDAAFQKKCIERVLQLKRRGMTIVFISHDLKAVEQLCERVVVMERGEAIFDGETSDAINAYAARGRFAAPATGADAKTAAIRSLEFFDAAGGATSELVMGEGGKVELRYLSNGAAENVKFAVMFVAMNGDWQCYFSTPFGLNLPPGEGCVEFSFAELGLRPGLYAVDVWIEKFGSMDPLDLLRGCTNLQVKAGANLPEGCLFFHPHRWKLKPADSEP